MKRTNGIVFLAALLRVPLAGLAVDDVGPAEPHAWGLRDMIGNVSEWTRSS